MNYEDFFSEEDVATFKRVKTGSMRIAAVSRQVIAEMVGGSIPVVGKEFVATDRGFFRMAMSSNSDNTTEKYAHKQMGVRTIVMGDDGDIWDFFELHGLDPDTSLSYLRDTIRERIHD